jgi:peptidyl-prolyl cis-trans isomerase SurA
MEEKKEAHTTESTTTDAHPQVKLMDKEPIAVAMEHSPEPVATHIAAPARRSWKFTAVAVVLVVVALLAVLFRLEKEGRVETNLFSGIIASQEANAKVAVVNGEALRKTDLTVSADQLAQAATAQGLDPNDPEVRAQIESQALEMIVNTELLTQVAAQKEIVIEDSVVAERITAIETDAGGAETLDARLAEFDITREMLTADVTTELTIRALLDSVFVDADMTITEEEIVTVYESAGGPDAGLPPLDEVRSQITAQLQQVREQAAVEEYLVSLREGADIEILIN